MEKTQLLGVGDELMGWGIYGLFLDDLLDNVEVFLATPPQVVVVVFMRVVLIHLKFQIYFA